MRKKTENIGAPESHPDCVYMDIIFNGIINDGEYFKAYLIREAKKALDSRVELKEFFSRCAGVCIYLRQQRQKEYKNKKLLAHRRQLYFKYHHNQ